MTRWKASAVHLLLSILVFCTIATLLIWRWYPPGLFHMAQADRLLVLIGGVDVVLGPLLTLIVYRQGKKSLKFDLTVIALMQMAALGYGLQTVWQTRPVYLVATVDRFNLVFANEIAEEDLARAPEEYRRLPPFGPRTVAVEVPTDEVAKSEALWQALAGRDLPVIPASYRPYDTAARALLSHSLPATALLKALPLEKRGPLERAIVKTGQPASQLAAVPIESARGDAMMLIDGETGTIVMPVGAAGIDFSALELPEANETEAEHESDELRHS